MVVNTRSGSQDPFYREPRWLKLSAEVRRGASCAFCNSPTNLHADHVLERSLYPMLSYDSRNLQVLCRSCHSSKTHSKQGVPKFFPRTGLDGFPEEGSRERYDLALRQKAQIEQQLKAELGHVDMTNPAVREALKLHGYRPN